MKHHAIYDTEILGSKNPLFLVRVKIYETGELFVFWHDKKGHTAKLERLIKSDKYTWVSFNGEHFDRPLLSAAIMGHDEDDLKTIATTIIDHQMNSWKTYKHFNLDFIEFDHIDLKEVAPGVMISLKTYMGRMGFPTMQDLPFHHDHDLSPADRKVVENYCLNDIHGTEWLFERLQEQLALRVQMSEEHGLDLRSKSDAQIAEAVLKKRLGIGVKGDVHMPRAVTYDAPSFIKTKHAAVNEIVDLMQNTEFIINRMNGAPQEAEWMKEPFPIGNGLYKVGLGGLHSQHDKNFYVEATDDLLISDFDVASYYPNIMMVAGLIPRLSGNKGAEFLEAYREIYEQRLAAKRAGNKVVANTLKIVLNGTFGKLGSIYSAFYSPDLLLAVTITGQLNLLCLIAELEALKDVTVTSANTDGVMVTYPPGKREKVLKVFQANAKRTGFEYEETPYRKVAMKDVNNYIAIPAERQAVMIDPNGVHNYKHKLDVKTKGLYAEAGLQKNPTMQVCSNAVVAYLQHGVPLDAYIRDHEHIEDFVAIRNVKGGGVQHKKVELVDDWVQLEPRLWESPSSGKQEKRVSRPKPFEVGIGGEPFGRVARWYMTTKQLPAITYVGSGNKVPKTEGAMLCMNLPKTLPKDLDFDWYVREAQSILVDLGVTNDANVVAKRCRL